jgi:hypothetical protein
MAEKVRTRGKEVDHEKKDYADIAGCDRHGGSVRWDGFCAAAKQEPGTDRRV